MRSLIVFTLITQVALAEVVGLENLLENATQPKQIEAMIEHQFNASGFKSLANTQTAPLRFDPSIAHSQTPTRNGFEYDVSFSKEFQLGDIQKLEQRSDRLESEATKLEQGKLLIGFSNRLKNSYHQYCLNQEYLGSFNEKYNRFSELLEKKKRAYEQDEISKIELVQIEQELQLLENRLHNIQTQVEDERQELLAQTTLPITDTLSCEDVYPLRAEFIDERGAFELSKEVYNKRIESRQTALKRYGNNIESIEVSTGYLKEFERDAFTIGVSIPLNFSSKKSEYERASLMEQTSALSSQNDELLTQKKYEMQQLKSKLKRLYQAVEGYELNIQRFKEQLLPLVHKSYTYGESSVVEYLLAQQQLSQKEALVLEKKREYYQTLFTLYNISEKR